MNLNELWFLTYSINFVTPVPYWKLSCLFGAFWLQQIIYFVCVIFALFSVNWFEKLMQNWLKYFNWWCIEWLYDMVFYVNFLFYLIFTNSESAVQCQWWTMMDKINFSDFLSQIYFRRTSKLTNLSNIFPYTHIKVFFPCTVTLKIYNPRIIKMCVQLETCTLPVK